LRRLEGTLGDLRRLEGTLKNFMMRFERDLREL
jgi:hypothetical protein